MTLKQLPHSAKKMFGLKCYKCFNYFRPFYLTQNILFCGVLCSAGTGKWWDQTQLQSVCVNMDSVMYREAIHFTPFRPKQTISDECMHYNEVNWRKQDGIGRMGVMKLLLTCFISKLLVFACFIKLPHLWRVQAKLNLSWNILWNAICFTFTRQGGIGWYFAAL